MVTKGKLFSIEYGSGRIRMVAMERVAKNEMGILNAMDGSSQFSIGESSLNRTRALVGILGPALPKLSRLENSQQLSVSLTFRAMNSGWTGILL